MLPDEAYELEEYMRVNPSQTMIVKPSRGRGGEGIFLIKKFCDLGRAVGGENLVQQYLESPLLLAGKKFDFRIYALITGHHPMKAYICNEGLARFCTVILEHFKTNLDVEKL